VTAQDAKNDAGPSQWERNSDPLNVAVARGGATRQTYATPRAEDSQCAGRRNSRETSDTLYAQTVTDTKSTPGSLSPLWVEWLQGFPPEWTDCAASVTHSVLTRWLRRSRTWLARLGY